MQQEEFLNDMMDILDLEEPPTLETVLADMEEWDSLAYLMFQSQALNKWHKKIQPTEIKAAQTVQDLYVLVK